MIWNPWKANRKIEALEAMLGVVSAVSQASLEAITLANASVRSEYRRAKSKCTCGAFEPEGFIVPPEWRN